LKPEPGLFKSAAIYIRTERRWSGEVVCEDATILPKRRRGNGLTFPVEGDLT
jgi:hypothetical protein